MHPTDALVVRTLCQCDGLHGKNIVTCGPVATAQTTGVLPYSETSWLEPLLRGVKKRASDRPKRIDRWRAQLVVFEATALSTKLQ